MFGFFKRKPTPPREAVEALISDTRKTIRAVYDMPTATQREIANSVLREAYKAEQRIEMAPPRERDGVRRELVGEWSARRRAAAMRPGADWSDPVWAFHAITEAWMFALSGSLGFETTRTLSDMISAMIDDVLPDGPDIGDAAAA